jgi:hypothetical protein
LCKYFVPMNLKRKMIPVGTIPGSGWWMKENGGKGKFK